MPSKLGIKIDQRQEEQEVKVIDNIKDLDMYDAQRNQFLDGSRNEQSSENRITITSLSNSNYPSRMTLTKTAVSSEMLPQSPTVIQVFLNESLFLLRPFTFSFSNVLSINEV